MAKRSKKQGSVVGAGPVPDWLIGLLLALVVLVTYSPVWQAGFSWDDDLVLTSNPAVTSSNGLVAIWTTHAADICPLTLSTFWCEHALWGLAPLPYHLVTVLFHAGCAVVLWRVLRALRVPGAWLGSTLWALHPVQVESAAWIAEMKNTESGLFFLLTILFYVRWFRAKDDSGQTHANRDYGLTLFFAALAMAAKSSTVILPVVLGLCAWWLEGRWRWRNLIALAPLFLMSIAAGVLSMWTQSLQLATPGSAQWTRSWPERIVAAGDAVWFYLGKLLWPHPLIFIYPRWQIDAAAWTSYLPLLAVIATLAVLWRARGAWARAGFLAFAYFVIALLPALGLIDNYIFRYSLVFDHFQYLASMSPLALLAAGLFGLCNRVGAGKAWLFPGLGAGLALILGIWSWQIAWIYQSRESLWLDTLAKNPASWSAHYNLGNLLSRRGQLDEAIDEFQKVLELNPTFADAHNNLGITLAEKGRINEATAQFEAAVRIDPRHFDAASNLGEAYLTQGRLDEAIAELQKAILINPNDADDKYWLGSALLGKGRTAEAIACLEKALQLRPDFSKARSARARAQATLPSKPASALSTP